MNQNNLNIPIKIVSYIGNYLLYKTMGRSYAVKEEFHKSLDNNLLWNNINILEWHKMDSNLYKISMKIGASLIEVICVLCIRSVPQDIGRAIMSLNKYSSNQTKLIVVPSLTLKKINLISEYGINTMDLTGNYCFKIGSKYFSDFKKSKIFKESNPIRSIFRDQGNILGVLLLNGFQTYQSLTDLQYYLEDNHFNISKSALSKRVKLLDKCNLLNKKKTSHKKLALTLNFPGRLLDQISNNFEGIHTTNKVYLNLKTKSTSKIQNLLRDLLQNIPHWTASGLTSLESYYFNKGKNENYTIYCSDFPKKMKSFISKDPTPICLYLTNDPRAFSGLRIINKFRWSSPVLSYLELFRKDKGDYNLEKLRRIIIDKYES